MSSDKELEAARKELELAAMKVAKLQIRNGQEQEKHREYFEGYAVFWYNSMTKLWQATLFEPPYKPEDQNIYFIRIPIPYELCAKRYDEQISIEEQHHEE